MQKIEALNALEVVDWSCSCGELEYVLSLNNEQNHKLLLDAGFTEQEILESCDDSKSEIDLSFLAFNFTEANYWTKEGKFCCKFESSMQEDL